MPVDAQKPNQTNIDSKEQKEPVIPSSARNNEQGVSTASVTERKVDIKQDEQNVDAEEESRQNAVKAAQEAVNQANEIGQIQQTEMKKSQEDREARLDAGQEKAQDISKELPTQTQIQDTEEKISNITKQEQPSQFPESQVQQPQVVATENPATQTQVEEKQTGDSEHKKGGILGFFKNLFGRKDKENNEPHEDSKAAVDNGDLPAMEELAARELKDGNKEKIVEQGGIDPESK